MEDQFLDYLLPSDNHEVTEDSLYTNYIYGRLSDEDREAENRVIIKNKDFFSSHQVVYSAQWLYSRDKISSEEWLSILNYYGIREE